MEEQINILIVDDKPDKLMAISSILEVLGQNVVSANSGREALRRLLHDDFAVILLDVNMPDMDGFETAALIRQRQRFEQTPIIFITAYEEESHAARGYSLGAVDYIQAPVDSEVLRTKVGVFVDLYRKTQTVRRQAEQRVELIREQLARAAAEQAVIRSTLLAEASRTLARSLDYETTLANIQCALVPGLADGCSLDVINPLGQSVTVPSTVSSGTEAADSDWRPPNLEPLIRRALDTGEPQLIEANLTAHHGPAGDHAKSALLNTTHLDNNAAPSARDINGAAAETARTVGVVVPLLARDQVLGTISLWRAGRSFDPTDLTLAVDISGRAATALDNAQLYRKIQADERRKDEFLAMLGHELRNPLAAMSSSIELLNLIGSPKQECVEARAILGRQTDLMRRLVDDLLDVSRITSGRIELKCQTIDAAETVARAVEAIRPMFDARQHTLKLIRPPGPLMISADPPRLEQIASNVLVNAAKYTDPGGKIDVILEQVEDQLCLTIRDNGVGIPAELLPRLFDLFAQANRSLDRSAGGLGIGLTVVQGLVQLHGGRITAHSDGPGRGSEFVVWLPALGPDEAMELPSRMLERKPEAASRSTKVMVVEDQETVARITVALLKTMGHEVALAKDAPSALELVQEFRPEIILMDIGLPGMNGYELAAAMREQLGAETPMLVALTGYGQEADRRRAEEAGFDEHVVKPISMARLKEIFSEAVARSN